MKTIDRLNRALQQIIANDSQQVRIEREITKRLVNERPQTSEAIERIITSVDKSLKNKAKLYVVLAQVRSILRRDSAKKEFVAVAGLMAMYSIKAPELFVKKMYDMSNGKVAKRARLIWNEFELSNETNVNKAVRANIRTKVKGASLTYRDLNKALEKGIEPDKLLRQTNEEWKVKRTLRTEAHEQAEIASIEVHEAEGYTHKVWRTQGDKVVRDTPWHNAVKGKTVPIGSLFRAGGLRANHPGDMLLPVGERVNCRCYLEYVKRS
jgi:hypothetical protein